MTSFEVKISPGGARGMSEENEEIPMLLLAPFQKPPTITFQDVQLGSKVERHLIISNRGSHNQVQVKFSKLPSSEHNFVFSDTELSLDPNETTAVIIRWAPSKLGSWREAVRVNYSSNARMDLPVYILFNSIPPIKKRKRNVGIRPLRHQNSVDPVYQVPKKNAKFIMSPKSRMSSSNRHDRKTTPNKENNAPRSGNRKGKKSTPVFGSPLIKLVGQTPTSILGLGQSKDSPSPPAKSRRSRSSGGHPSSSASRLKSRRSRSSSHTDFFDYISALTLSPVTLRLNGIPTPVASRGQPSDSTPLRRETFLTSRTQSVPGDDNEEDDGFLSLNGRLLPPCSVAPSPLRRTTYDVGGFVDLGEEFVPASRDPLPPCTVPPSPWRRTTYLASENVRPGGEEETFFSLTGARLPPCDVDPSPLRRTTYTAYDVRSSPPEMSWGEIPSMLRPNAKEAKRARDNPFGLGESSRVLKEKTHNFSNVVSGPTPRRSRKTTYTTASESTYENFENIIEGIAYSVTRSTCTYTEKKKKNYSSSESDKFSGDSLDDASTREETSSAVNVPVPVCKALRFDDEEDVASDGLPVDEDHERKMRRCSNETYVKSPCSSSVADYRTPSAAVVSPDGNESVQSVIQAGLWCEPFRRNVSQSSDVASSGYSTRSKTRASSSGKKTISRTGPPAARRGKQKKS